jgi:hypothetical protein
MTINKYTDSSGDTLKLVSYGAGTGYITVDQGEENSACFELNKENRKAIATELLVPLDATVVDAKLPATEIIFMSNGHKRISCGGVRADTSPSEAEYFRASGLKYLAVAQRIDAELANEEEARQKRLAGLEQAKLRTRRDALAQQFMNNSWANYAACGGATRNAIDRVIELEDAAK